jgi:hypothetical protein
VWEGRELRVPAQVLWFTPCCCQLHAADLTGHCAGQWHGEKGDGRLEIALEGFCLQSSSSGGSKQCWYIFVLVLLYFLINCVRSRVAPSHQIILAVLLQINLSLEGCTAHALTCTWMPGQPST